MSPWRDLCHLCCATAVVLTVPGCGGSSDDLRRGQAPEPTSTAGGDPPLEPEGADGGETPEELAALVDPSGHSQVRALERRGSRVYALVERNVVEAGWAAVASRPDRDAVEGDFEAASGACLSRELGALRCIAGVAPNLAYLADMVAGRGASWAVSVIEGGRVVASRPLVALSVHHADDGGPVMRVEDLDEDGRDELHVDVPVRPLRDDSLFTWGDTEKGTAAFVLDETLDVQARWTSSWLLGENEDGGDAPAGWTSCTTTGGVEGRALQLERACDDDGGESAQRRVICPYVATDDVFRCSEGSEGELFQRYSPALPHYVGETAEALGLGLTVDGRLTE